MRRLLVMLSLALPGAAGAQAPATVDPGMSRAQVLERLGQPSGERATGAFTYLFFRNGCERTCGMSDLVTLRGDSVVDAIFRTPTRRFTGRSSSPAQVAPTSGAPSAGRATSRTLPATRGGHIPPGHSGGIVTAGPPTSGAAGAAQDPPETPGLRVPPRRVAAPTPVGGAPRRVDPRDSLSPRIDERATHEAHAADRTQARESQVPRQRDTALSPAARPAPNVPPAPFTGSRPSPTDSARLARQREIERARPPRD